MQNDTSSIDTTVKVCYPELQKGGDSMTESKPQSRGEIRIDGDKLRLVAKRQGMTLNVLAEAMGMHYNGVLRIATTGSTNLGTLEELCNVLQCNPLDLLVWDNFPEYDPNSDAPVDPSYRDKVVRAQAITNAI